MIVIGAVSVMNVVSPIRGDEPRIPVDVLKYDQAFVQLKNCIKFVKVIRLQRQRSRQEGESYLIYRAEVKGLNQMETL